MHKAATRKVSRVKSTFGAEVSGTRYDPRRDPSKIKSYTTPQLKAYMRDLGRFNSRQTQFVAGADNVPLKRQTWQSYVQAEQAFNQRLNQRLDRVKDIRTPDGGMTLGERNEMLPKHPVAGEGASGIARKEVHRGARQFPSEDKLVKMTRQIKEKSKRSQTQKELKAAQQSWIKISADLKNKSLSDAVKRLSPEQFDMLWNYTRFSTNVSLPYEIAKDMLSKKDKMSEAKQSELQNQYDIQLREAHKAIMWAEKIKLPKA